MKKARRDQKVWSRREAAMRRWALSVKPGDYIGTCEGHNRKVAKVIDKRHNGVVFEDTHGYWHYCPGGGCAVPPETIRQITDYFKECYRGFDPLVVNEWTEKLPSAKVCALAEAVNAGKPFLDSNGELLPEFDYHHEVV